MNIILNTYSDSCVYTYVCVYMEYTSFSLKRENKKGYVWTRLININPCPIYDSDVENVFPLQILLKWQDFPETTLSVCF